MMNAGQPIKTDNGDSNSRKSAHGRPQLLSRAECSALRGLAIAGIVLHNYCHWLAPIVKENEYTYTSENVKQLTKVMLSPDINLPVHLLSFFGHYGVPVFLFLSAYGLVMKYEGGGSRTGNSPTSGISVLSFIRHHFVKLFDMMIVGFIVFTMIDAITPGAFHYTFTGIIAQLGMVNNFIPHPDKVIWPGPYWFFGLMLQLYIVYRLLLYKRKWTFTVGLIAVCWVVQAVCQPDGETLNYLRYNFIGGVLPFGAGLLYARYGRDFSKYNYATCAVVSAVLILAFSYNFQLWFIVPLLVCAFSIALVKLLPPKANRGLDWLGSISAALFVCHPITRKIFIPISRQGDVYTGLLLYVIASIAVAMLFREIMNRIGVKK
jgi:peptidoglycan/LPS O-acetylase OafA/YrhL